MNPGKLDERVRLKRITETADATGQLQPTESILATVWANVEELTGDERVITDKMGAMMSHKITIRDYDGLTVKDLVYRELTSTTLNIKAIRRLGRKAFLELECVEQL